MNTKVISFILALPCSTTWAGETAITPATRSAALFKNGVVLIRTGFDAPAAGDYVWVDPPPSVHGAFFVEGVQGIAVRSTQRDMPATGVEMLTGSLQQDLSGADVSVTLAGEGGQTFSEVQGTVWRQPADTKRTWNTRYDPQNPYASLIQGNAAGQGAQMSGSYLVMEAGGGRQYLATSRISAVKVLKPAAARPPVTHSVLIFFVPAAGPVDISFLTRGMAWIPSYRVDLTGPKQLRLTQSAVVRNELMDLPAAELQLLSGYPNIKFSHVDSMLSPGANLTSFFQQLSQDGRPAQGSMSQQMAYNSISNSASAAAPLPEPDKATAGEDLHAESIGKRALAAGDSLSLDVASANCECERVIEWKVPDYRDDYGRLTRQRQQGHDDESDPWDAVQFPNPLKFPLTTAAASVTEGGKFLGQSMANWTAPGQTVCVRITKALTIRGEYSEVEEEGAREKIWIGGNDYQKTRVKGELKLANSRSEAVKVVVRADFSGELLEASNDPAKSLRPDGVWSVNPHRQLEWTITLPAGKTQTLTYRYAVNVDI